MHSAWWTGGSAISTRLRAALENSKVGETEYLSQVDASLHWTADRYTQQSMGGSAVPVPQSARTVLPTLSPPSGIEEEQSTLSPQAAALIGAASPKRRTGSGSMTDSLRSVSGGDSDVPVGMRPLGQMVWARGPPAPALAGMTLGLETVAPRQDLSGSPTEEIIEMPSASLSLSAVATSSGGGDRGGGGGLSSTFASLELSPVANSSGLLAAAMRSESAMSDASPDVVSSSARGGSSAPPQSPTADRGPRSTTSGRPSKLSAVLATLSSTVERERVVINQRTASATSRTQSSDWRARHGERMEEFRLGSVMRDGTLASRLS